MSDDTIFPEEETSENSSISERHFSVPADINYTKKNLQAYAEGKVGEVLDSGNVDPAELYITLKAMAEVVSASLEIVKPHAIEEAEKYGKEGLSMNNVKLTVKNSADKLRYDHNEEWKKLDDQEKKIKEAKKKLETTMKAAMGTAGILDDEGVITPPAKIDKPGGTTLAASIPNK